MTQEHHEIENHLSYCNGTQFVHYPESVREATAEFATLLAEMIEPVGELSDEVHLQQVVLILAGAAKEPIRTIDSGKFECEHTRVVRA